MKKLPIVMPANRSGMARELEDRFPNRIGLLFSPNGKRSPKGLPYALDNDRFSVWAKGKTWSKEAYYDFLVWAKSLPYPPAWAIVPDVVADPAATEKWWARWAPIVKEEFGYVLAVAVQDGMTPNSVRKMTPTPEVIFVGGTTHWKWRHLRKWTTEFPRVHVGRVNTIQLLWRAHRAGAESTDGSGWYHRKQYRQLVRYLEMTSSGFADSGGRDNFLEAVQ